MSDPSPSPTMSSSSGTFHGPTIVGRSDDYRVPRDYRLPRRATEFFDIAGLDAHPVTIAIITTAAAAVITATIGGDALLLIVKPETLSEDRRRITHVTRGSGAIIIRANLFPLPVG